MRHERETRLPVSVWIQLDLGLVDEEADERDMFGRRSAQGDCYCCFDDVMTLAQQLGLVAWRAHACPCSVSASRRPATL